MTFTLKILKVFASYFCPSSCSHVMKLLCKMMLWLNGVKLVITVKRRKDTSVFSSPHKWHNELNWLRKKISQINDSNFKTTFRPITYDWRNVLQRSTVEPRYPDTLQNRKKCRHKRSVEVTGVGETYVYKKMYFLWI